MSIKGNGTVFASRELQFPYRITYAKGNCSARAYTIVPGKSTQCLFAVNSDQMQSLSATGTTHTASATLPASSNKNVTSTPSSTEAPHSTSPLSNKMAVPVIALAALCSALFVLATATLVYAYRLRSRNMSLKRQMNLIISPFTRLNGSIQGTMHCAPSFPHSQLQSSSRPLRSNGKYLPSVPSPK